MASNRYWLGGAVAVPEVKAYVFALTWATGDTASITINGKTLTLTAGATATVAQVTLDMIDMINGGAANGTETRSALGSEIGEFAILTATGGTTGQVILTGPSNGRPIGTVTVDSTTAGDGTWAAVGGAPDVTGTGPNHWDNVDNWDADTLPVATDTIIFDHRAMSSPLFATTMAFAPARIVVTDGFKYSLGLPAVNRDSASHPFDEHQEQYVIATSCADVRINAVNAGAIKLSMSATDAASTIVVDGTGRAAETGIPACLLKVNYNTSDVTVNNGSVGICLEPTTAGSIRTLTVGGVGSPSVVVGDTVTLVTVISNSGSTVIQTAPTTITVNGGSVEQKGAAIGATTLNVNGGTMFPKTAGSTYGTVTQSAGTIDCTADSRTTRTFTNYYMYGGALKDPAGTLVFTNGIRVYPKLSSVSLDLPAVRKYTIGAV